MRVRDFVCSLYSTLIECLQVLIGRPFTQLRNVSQMATLFIGPPFIFDFPPLNLPKALRVHLGLPASGVGSAPREAKKFKIY